MRSKVFVTRLIPSSGLEMLRAECDVEVWEDELPPPRNLLLEKARTHDALLTLLTDKVDAELLDTNPGLCVVANMAVGFDNVDVPAATARGVPIGNTPGVLTDTTADFAFTLLMSAARRVVEGVDYVRAAKWKTWGPMLLMGPDVHHATLGIIGFGRIGQGMAKRAKGFDMRILYHDVYRRRDLEESMGVTYADLDTVYREADFISLHTDLNASTLHMINDAAFAKMKPNAVIINTARGPIIDPEALARALSEKRIGAAALDVTEPEPIPMDSPLLKLANCIVVPHLASASIATRTKMSQMAAANILAGLKGERLPTCVNPEVYDKSVRK